MSDGSEVSAMPSQRYGDGHDWTGLNNNASGVGADAGAGTTHDDEEQPAQSARSGGVKRERNTSDYDHERKKSEGQSVCCEPIVSVCTAPPPPGAGGERK
jgi:hypothetical protein